MAAEIGDDFEWDGGAGGDGGATGEDGYPGGALGTSAASGDGDNIYTAVANESLGRYDPNDDVKGGQSNDFGTGAGPQYGPGGAEGLAGAVEGLAGVAGPYGGNDYGDEEGPGNNGWDDGGEGGEAGPLDFFGNNENDFGQGGGNDGSYGQEGGEDQWDNGGDDAVGGWGEGEDRWGEGGDNTDDRWGDEGEDPWVEGEDNDFGGSWDGGQEQQFNGQPEQWDAAGNTVGGSYNDGGGAGALDNASYGAGLEAGATNLPNNAFPSPSLGGDGGGGAPDMTFEDEDGFSSPVLLGILAILAFCGYKMNGSRGGNVSHSSGGGGYQPVGGSDHSKSW